MYNSLDIKQLKIAPYKRKSSEGEDKQVASLPAQGNAFKDFVNRMGVNSSQIIVDIEEARSAKIENKREGFKKLLNHIDSGKINAVWTWHPNRLSRNSPDINELIKRLENGKLLIIYTQQGTFTNTPLEKFMLSFSCLQAKLENDNKGEDVKRGLKEKVEMGWRPGPAPIGYLNNKGKEYGKKDISPDPVRFPLVRKIWDLFLTGKYSVRRLQDIANNQLGIRTRKTAILGDKPLSLSNVYDILNEPFYYGSYWWKNEETGIKELRIGAHHPLIKEEEFLRGQMLLGRKFIPQSKTHLWAYTGLIRCEECGSSVTAEEKWQIICGLCKTKFASLNKDACPKCKTKIIDMENKKVLHYVFYHCTKKKNRNCSQKSIRLENLEIQIDNALKRFNIGEKYMRWAIETLKEDTNQEINIQKQIDSNIKRGRTKLKERLAELNRFIISQENAGWTLMTREEALAEKTQIMSELTKVELGQEENNQRASKWFDSSVELFDYACHARFWLQEGTIDKKRSILEGLGTNLTLKDKKLIVDLKYPLPEIEHMLEIAPEISGPIEPKSKQDNIRISSSFQMRIPTLLRG